MKRPVQVDLLPDEEEDVFSCLEEEATSEDLLQIIEREDANIETASEMDSSLIQTADDWTGEFDIPGALHPVWRLIGCKSDIKNSHFK